ncbi:hypothetical protein NG798_27400 [Ancylothrix sp. C2]|uniref:hypothetical protein n=1 Tax=Ancylothrix sp. D3o TaxID=2953691 RepID=UPI0021BAE90B|nr:hypothetical protein [Ancylothrix sp. D3o]MCT7953527.1 hypothetical protein [Ancylothrix sp. D3o]
MTTKQTKKLSAEIYWSKQIISHIRELINNSQAGDEFVGEILKQYQTGIIPTAQWYVQKLASPNETYPTNLDYEVIGTLIEGFVAFLKEKHTLQTQP